MPLITWKDEFSCGAPEVDRQHQELIGLINDLHAGIENSAHNIDEIAHFLGRIYTLVETHFAFEEQIMQEMDYEDYPGHKMDHDLLLDDIREVMNDFDDGAYDNFESMLAKKMTAWFAVHFRTRDAMLHGVLG